MFYYKRRGCILLHDNEYNNKNNIRCTDRWVSCCGPCHGSIAGAAETNRRSFIIYTIIIGIVCIDGLLFIPQERLENRCGRYNDGLLSSRMYKLFELSIFLYIIYVIYTPTAT
jgi:hypothetical protein